MTNGNKFKSEYIPMISELLERADSIKVYTTELKSPSMILIISILVGQLGIDRYVLGDKKMGTVKLLLFLLMYIFLMSIGVFGVAMGGYYYDYDTQHIPMMPLICASILFILIFVIFILWIYDVVTISGRTKEVNLRRLCKALGYSESQGTFGSYSPQADNYRNESSERGI